MKLNMESQYKAAALAAATAASEKLMARFKAGAAGLRRWEKSPGALVTEADIESDRAIADALARSGRGGVIISEESSADLGRASADADEKIEWLIDPLCGTVPFSSGMDHWGINIAMRRDGELAVSVLATPPSGVVISASLASGVEINGETLLPADPERELGEAVIGLEIDGQDQWHTLLESGGLHWVTSVGQVNGFSSAAYPLMLVCTGRMPGVVFYRIEPMHVAAGCLAATLLGARVTDGEGNAIDWSRDDELSMVVVGWPRVHEQLMRVMKAGD